jgi:hypothetical protein
MFESLRHSSLSGYIYWLCHITADCKLREQIDDPETSSEVIYRLPRDLMTTESPVWCSMFEVQCSGGTSVDDPIHLQQVTKEDMDYLLDYLLRGYAIGRSLIHGIFLLSDG